MNWFGEGVKITVENYKKRDKSAAENRIFPSEALWLSLPESKPRLEEGIINLQSCIQ
jgi:hypothetical protein